VARSAKATSSFIGSRGDGTEGFTVKGDNNNNLPDPWTPRLDDIAGKTWFTLPGLGRLTAYVHRPIIAAR